MPRLRRLLIDEGRLNVTTLENAHAKLVAFKIFKLSNTKIMMTRRQAIKTSALASAALAALPNALPQSNAPSSMPAATSGPFTLPPLPYAYDALEPYVDGRTM